ncbi:MAG: hypothetical protein IKS66_01900, partial [Oscillospiraceae bacterium]|nr:hypothetical protein [Oscillospiraceae bacterium]
SSPKDYWWEVTDKEGTRYFYGSYDGTSCDTGVLMSDSLGNIGHWPLCRAIDINGNHMTYRYSKRLQYSEYQASYPATSPLRNAPPVYLGQQLWPEVIQYTGHDGDTGRYRVVFCSDAVSRDSAYRRSCAVSASASASRGTTPSASVKDTARKTASRSGDEGMEWTEEQRIVAPDPAAPSDAPCTEGTIPVTICLESPCAQSADLSGATIGIGRTEPVFADNGNGTPYPVTFDFAGNQYRTEQTNGTNCVSFMVCPEVTYYGVVQPPTICGSDPVSFRFRIGADGSLTVTDGNGVPMIGAEVTAAGHTISVPVECDCNLPSACYDCVPGEPCYDCPPVYRKKVYIGVQDNFCKSDRLPHCLFSLTRVNDPFHTEYHYTTGYPRIQPVEVRENELYHVHGYWFGGGYQQSPVDFDFSVSGSGCVTIRNEEGILSSTDPHILVKDYTCNGNYGFIEVLMPVVPERPRVRICMKDSFGYGISGCRMLLGKMSDSTAAGLYVTDATGHTQELALDTGIAFCIGETEASSVNGNTDYRNLLAGWQDAVRLYLKGTTCGLKRGSLSTPAADSVRYRDGVFTYYYSIAPRQSGRETVIRVHKTDSASGLPLEGALFGYGRRCDGSHVLGTALTDADGNSSGIPLRCGVTYRVRELYPPAGYRRSSPAYAIVRGDADGNLQVLESRHLNGLSQSGDGVWTLEFGNQRDTAAERPFPAAAAISCDSYAYDNTVGLRSGYRQSSKEKLLQVMVFYRDSCVRSYSFCYGQDLFGRARLESASEWGADPSLGSRDHRFDYYGETSNRQYFGPTRTTSVDVSPVDAALLPLLTDPLLYFSVAGLTQPTLLGGSRTIASDISAGASLGLFPDFPLRTLSAGLNVSGSFSTGKGRTSLTDINGDGLPDLVYDSLRPFVRLQKPDGSFEGRPRAVGGYQSFLRDYSDNVGFGPQVSSVVNGSVQRGWSSSWTSNYLADMDGDGLVDLVTPRNVLHPSLPQRPPKFTFAECLPPQAALAEDTVRVRCDDRFSFRDVPYERDRSAEIRYDLVRVWEAELDDSQLQDLTYSVCAPVRLSHDSIALENFCGEADSVIVSIEYYGTGLTGTPAHLLLWSDVIGDSDTLPHGPDHCSASPIPDGPCVLRIRKVDMEGMPLEGAEFEVDGSSSFVTEAGGFWEMDFSEPGCITLQETFSPCNGTLPSVRICIDEGCGITVEPAGVVEPDDVGTDNMDVTTEVVDGRTVHTVTVTNDCVGGRGTPQTRSNRAYTNPAYDLSALPLAKGDRLYFRLRPQDNGVRKKALWDPAVIPHSTLLAAAGGLDENGRTFGGGDRASESQLLQGDSLFCCPAKGKIGIESVIPQPGSPLSDSVRFEIWRGQTLIDHYTIESGQMPSERRFVKYLSVNSLEKIKFVARCRSNVDMTLLHWTPKVYYISIDTGNGSVPTVTTNSAGDSVRLMEYAVAPWHDFYPHVSVPGGAVCHSICNSPATMVPVQRSITSVTVTSAAAGSGWLTVKQEGRRAYARRVVFGAGTTTLPANSYAMLEDDPGKPVHISLCLENPSVTVSSCTVTIDGIPRQAVIYARRANDILTGSHYGGWGQFQYRTGRLPDTDPLSLMDLGKLRTLHRITAQNAGQYADTTALGRSLGSVECFSRSDSFDMRMSAISDTLHCLPMNNDAVYHGHAGFYANTFIRGAAMNLGGIPCPGFLREAGEAEAYCPEQEGTEPEGQQRGVSANPPVRGLALSNVLDGRSSSKKSSSTTSSSSSGLSVVGIGSGRNSSENRTCQERDLMDLNGDGFPDLIVKDTGVWYSFPSASLWESACRDPFNGEAHHFTVTVGSGKSFSADFSTIVNLVRNSGRHDKAAVKSQEEEPDPQVVTQLNSHSGSESHLTDLTIWTLTDINGDGLPDRVYSDNSVALNCGYGFQSAERWEIGDIGRNHSVAYSSSLGVPLGGKEFSGGDKSYSGGVSGSESYNRPEEMLADLNSDGRPDRVVILPDRNVIHIHYNTGCGFNKYYDSIIVSGGDLYRWTSTRSLGANFGLTLGFPVGGWAKVSATGGADLSISLSASVVQFMDMDGDGHADMVISPDDHTLYVRHSTLGRAGLLKTVTNPLGGSVTLGYRQTEANVFHSRRWVMDTLLVCDSLPGDGADTRMTTWDYACGYYDRTEREFLGFAKVTERHHNTMDGNTIKRTYTRYFRNDS